MSKPLSKYTEEERPAVIARRLKEKKGGLGYLSAKAHAKAEARKKARKKARKAAKARAKKRKETKA
jgi:hypothetical protein